MPRSVRIALLLLVVAGSACGHSSDGAPDTGDASGLSPGFEVREVLDSSLGSEGDLADAPFTSRVLRTDDPYRDDPGFSEQPAGEEGNAVTFADSDGNGFYSPNIDMKVQVGPAAILATDVREATAVDLGGDWTVEVRLDEHGTEGLRALTSRLVGKQAAMLYDRLVIAAPTVQDTITTGNIQIAGNLTETEAHRIADDLDGSR